MSGEKSKKTAIQLPVVFDAANRKKDRSLSLRMTTTLEISNEDFAQIDKVVNSTGYMLFSPNGFDDGDVPLDDAPTDGKKPSQRLRGALFVLWQKEGEGEEFDDFYKRNMSRLIDWVKDRIAEHE